jgi:hypothetical protein
VPKPAADQNVIKIFLPYDNKSVDRMAVLYSKESFYKSISKRKVIKVDLYEEDSATRYFLLRRKFDFVTRETERLSFTGDTTTVLKINLDDSNTLVISSGWSIRH